MKLPDFRKMRAAMIDSQLRPSGVTDPDLIAAIKYVPRELFVPAEVSSLAYRDEDIEVVPGRYLIEPLVACRLMAELDPQPRDRVLIVGGATGYSAAILARLTAHVTMVENDATLVRRAESAVFKTGVANVEVVEGALSEGHAAGAPYDMLLIEGTIEVVPPALIAQVANGGRIGAVLANPGLAPQASVGVVSSGYVAWRSIMEAGVPRLPGFERPRVFEF